MVFQHFALYPHLDVYRNLAFGLKLRRVPRAEIEVRVREAARKLGIEPLLQRRPAELSGGQRQRVALGRAIVRDPQVFLFDEPLSNLDARWRESLRTDLVELQRQLGTTTIHVTHDQVEAMMIGQRIAVMDAGRIQQVGKPLEVYHAPANRFVAAFIGSPPMNLLPCEVDIQAGKILFEGDRALDISGYRERWGGALKNGRDITLGVRPENISISATEIPGSIPSRVYVVQPLGGEWLVVTQVGAELVSVRLFQDEAPELAEHVWLKLDLDRTFLYDKNGDLLQ